MTHTFHAPKLGVIPAAGKGTRFLPSTKATPKEMHPLLNYPLIHHCLQELADAGVDEAIIISHRDKKTLENYFTDHGELKALLEKDNKPDLVHELQKIENLPKVSFAYQDEQLGLAHAVLSAKKEIAERDFYLLLPDEIFLPNQKNDNPCVELKTAFLKTGKSAVSLLPVPDEEVHKYGVAQISSENLIEDIVEKPPLEEAPSNLILPGRYLFTHKILQEIERTPPKEQEVQLTDAIVSLSKKEGVVSVVSRSPRYDGGSLLGFLKANIHAAMKDPKLKTELLNFIKDF